MSIIRKRTINTFWTGSRVLVADHTVSSVLSIALLVGRLYTDGKGVRLKINVSNNNKLVGEVVGNRKIKCERYL